MKDSILLVQLPHEGRKPSNYPIGLGLISGILKKEGYRVEGLDIWSNQYSFYDVNIKIAEANVQVFGISALSTQYAYAKELCTIIKAHHSESIIILGGALATHSYKTVLKHLNVDICVIGEGEETMLELMDCISNEKSIENVSGIAFASKDEIIVTNTREQIKDLDKIWTVDYGLFKIDDYIKNCKIGESRHFGINIITNRGCPFHCSYCSKNFKGVRNRSISAVIDEIKQLVMENDINGIYIDDELFVHNKDRVLEFCEKVKPLNLKWICQGRANTINAEILKAMHNAGCIEMGMGIESGSNKILKEMNKGVTVDDNIRAVKMCNESGIRPRVLFMTGYPGEDEETMKEHIKFFKNINLPCHGFSITLPLPGTQLYDYALKNNLIESDEDAYLTRISGGYYMKGNSGMVNLTGFTDEELVLKSNKMVSITKWNYFKRNFWRSSFYSYYLKLFFCIKNIRPKRSQKCIKK